MLHPLFSAFALVDPSLVQYIHVRSPSARERSAETVADREKGRTSGQSGDAGNMALLSTLWAAAMPSVL